MLEPKSSSKAAKDMQRKIIREENSKITKTINKSIEQTVIERAKLGKRACFD